MVEALKLISRIKHGPDGSEFLNYLHTLSKDNYEAFKSSPAVASEVHKGYALCIDSLIKVFETCDDRLHSLEIPTQTKEWL